MILRKILAILVAFVFYPATQADASPISDLLEAKSIRCDFDKGAAASWDNGDVNVSSDNFGEGGRVFYTDINHKSNTAKSSGNNGESDLVVIATPGGINFLEATGVGNMIFTSIFADYAEPEAKKYFAVTSRHVNVFGNPIPSQYHGTCIIAG
ncbi:MAG: hypothetical protein ACR2P4_08760 [Gammaproteobacteria bacterium]